MFNWLCLHNGQPIRQLIYLVHFPKSGNRFSDKKCAQNLEPFVVQIIAKGSDKIKPSAIIQWGGRQDWSLVGILCPCSYAERNRTFVEYTAFAIRVKCTFFKAELPVERSNTVLVSATTAAAFLLTADRADFLTAR